jgi:hypothetical protein
MDILPLPTVPIVIANFLPRLGNDRGACVIVLLSPNSLTLYQYSSDAIKSQAKTIRTIALGNRRPVRQEKFKSSRIQNKQKQLKLRQ